MAFGYNPETLIVSNAHISISNVVQEVFPGTAYGLCYYHLLNKFTRYGQAVTTMFGNAAYSYRRTAYNRAMTAIQALSPNGAYTKLMDIGPERWARSKCPVRRYGFLTSNAAEVLNARLLWARRLPICSLIECIRHILEDWFDKRRARANARENALTEEALKKLREEVEKGRRYTVVTTAASTFKVNDGRQTFIVDLNQKSCKCREFLLDLMPCSHAVAAIMQNGESIMDYVSSYYTTHNWCETYERSVRSLPHRDEWVAPTHITQREVTPLIVTRQAGHPSGAEAGNRRRRAPKKCDICRDPSHTRNNCPDRNS